jgi:hypothetical protein
MHTHINKCKNGKIKLKKENRHTLGSIIILQEFVSTSLNKILGSIVFSMCATKEASMMRISVVLQMAEHYI